MEQSCWTNLDYQWDEYLQLHHELFRISEAMWRLEDYVMGTYSHLDAASASVIVAEVASEVAEDVLRSYKTLITCFFTSAIRLKVFARLAKHHILYADDLAELARNEAVTLLADLERQLSVEARAAAASAAVQAVFGNRDLMQRYIIPAVLGDDVSVREDDRGWVLDCLKLGQVGIGKALKAVQAMCKDWYVVCKGWHDAPALCVRLPPKRAAFCQASINAPTPADEASSSSSSLQQPDGAPAEGEGEGGVSGDLGGDKPKQPNTKTYYVCLNAKQHGGW